MMGRRYPSDEKGDKEKFSLVDTMVKHMWVFLDQSGSDLKFDQFFDKLENWVNQDDKVMKEFVFECYDTLSQGRLTDEGMFKFMNIMTKKVPGTNNQSTQMLKLNEHESDMFLDLFANDFCKIS